MLVGENDAIINLNLLETHGKLGLAPRVNLVTSAGDVILGSENRGGTSGLWPALGGRNPICFRNLAVPKFKWVKFSGAPLTPYPVGPKP